MRNFKREAVLVMFLMLLLGVSSFASLNPAHDSSQAVSNEKQQQSSLTG
jgi:hypothetical protein